MIKLIKKIYHNSTIGRKVFAPLKWCYDFFWVRIAPEKSYLKRIYRFGFNHKLNFENPKTIQEKYLWLRLNDKTPLHTLCADKYAVRKYVRDNIGEQYLVSLILDTVKPTDLIPSNLPKFPFIIKTNHGCGGYVIVKDKSKVDWENVQKVLRKSLKSNFYNKGRELQYKNIKPRILVEKLLLDNNLNAPLEYKFHCYNGIVNMVEVYIDKYTKYRINYYSTEWELLNFRCRTVPNGRNITKPINLNEMKSIAETLSKSFRAVRIDLYYYDRKIFFGEMTFTPAMGLQSYIPNKWNLILGERLKL